MIWKFQKPWPQKRMHIGCLYCSPVMRLLSMERVLMVGFGACTVSKDNMFVYHESPHEMEKWDYDYPITAMMYERIAAKDPEHDWRIAFYGPMHEEEYQRQGPGCWVMIHSGPGFA